MFLCQGTETLQACYFDVSGVAGARKNETKPQNKEFLQATALTTTTI